MRFKFAAASFVLALVVPSYAFADELNLTYKGEAAAWPATSTEIENKLCVGLIGDKLPSDDAQASLGLVTKGTGGAWVAVKGEGDTAPWPKAKWAEAGGHHCFEAPLPGKTYSIGVILNGAVSKVLSTNDVTVTANATASPAAADTGSSKKSDAEIQHDKDVMSSAREYAAGLSAQVDRSSVTGQAKVTLYFFPDGTPVRAIPSDLSERDDITIKVLVAKADIGTASLNVSACPDEVPFRLQGTYKQAAGFGQGKVEIGEQDLGSLRCGAGQVSFEVKGPQGSATTSLKLGEVYWGTFGVQFTFDFTKEGTLGTSKNAAGMTVITRSDDLLGPKVVPTFVWHPFGYDPHHASVLGVLLNPSLGFDVDAMTNSFYVGDQICAAGLCLAAGAHIRKVNELAKTSGLSEGSAFDPTAASLPVEDRWSGKHGGVGPYIGVTVDVNTAAKMLGGSD